MYGDILKVLLVDDEPDFLKQAKIFLERENDRLEVETAYSPEEALGMLKENDYGGVISDYQMPETTGLEFLKKVRNEVGSDIPFVIFTGKGREEVAMKALNLGADRYLQKGGDPKSQYGILGETIVQEIENRQMQKALERSREKTEILLDYYPAMIFFINKNNEFFRVNQTLADSLDMNKEEIEGKLLDDIFTEDIAEEMKENNRQVLERGEPNLDLIERYQSSKGTRWAQVDKLPLRDENGDAVGVIGFARDITERKKAEEKKDFLHSLLRHDVRNKNQVVKGYHKLLRDFNLPNGAEDYLEKAEKTIDESIDLINKVSILREVERNSFIQEVNLNSYIDKAVEKKAPQAEQKGIQIEKDTIVQSEVRGGDLLEELFLNLIENSIKHSGASKIRISSENSDNRVICILEDDGEGIDDEIKKNIFERGFTEGENSGSGLGLYLVEEIAKSYGGKVQVEDSELGGAQFEVHLKKTKN